MEYFIFNGISSTNFGMYISKKKIYSFPARDMSFQAVPGRNGDVIIDNGRYENIEISYTVGFKNLKENISEIKNWLCQSGYCRLTDTYQPDCFRYAAFSTKLDISETIKNVGEATITFNCKPYIYNFYGQEAQTFTGSFSIYNFFGVNAEPYIKITGTGTVHLNINERTYTIKDIDEYIEIDSELMNAFKENTLCNKDIGFTEFPVLKPGESYISFVGDVEKIEIIPRWRWL